MTTLHILQEWPQHFIPAHPTGVASTITTPQSCRSDHNYASSHILQDSSKQTACVVLTMVAPLILQQKPQLYQLFTSCRSGQNIDSSTQPAGVISTMYSGSTQW